jgi:hypothetical protein
MNIALKPRQPSAFIPRTGANFHHVLLAESCPQFYASGSARPCEGFVDRLEGKPCSVTKGIGGFKLLSGRGRRGCPRINMSDFSDLEAYESTFDIRPGYQAVDLTFLVIKSAVSLRQ